MKQCFFLTENGALHKKYILKIYNFIHIKLQHLVTLLNLTHAWYY